MEEKPKRRRFNVGTLIGWLIFILAFGGSTIFRLLRQLFGGNITLPPDLLPILIGGLVVLSIAIGVVRALSGSLRRGGDTRLPTAPMPPFGGPARPAAPTSPRAFTMPRSNAEARPPNAPRFEPVVNPLIIVLGIVGLIVIGAAAAVLIGMNAIANP